MRTRTGWRDHAFIIAAIALPVLVAAFFLLATAIPRWTTPLPAYDVILRTPHPGASPQAPVTISFEVRDGRLVAIARPAAPNMYVTRWALLRVDHATLQASEIPFTEPDRLDDGERQRVIPVAALASVTVSAALEAPDGYSVQTRSSSGGPGLIGDVFGMRSYRQRSFLRGHGRTVEVRLPAPFGESYSDVSHVAWVTNDGPR